ncbi:excalibur calcium-binding domain-containing protein [Nocardia sp. NPDC059180]|uniref:excalibur calcium-binding domain-containing protein n=1 Tax=Nocardia sp. NPDC059180 TaxID=3346761 RepID=UPI0036C9EA75
MKIPLIPRRALPGAAAACLSGIAIALAPLAIAAPQLTADHSTTDWQTSPNQLDEPHQRPTGSATPKESPFYLTCGEARRDGDAPILRGQRGYSMRLDPDGNGRACEPGEL